MREMIGGAIVLSIILSTVLSTVNGCGAAKEPEELKSVEVRE